MGRRIPALRLCREENFGILFERTWHVDLQVSTVLRELRNVQGVRLVRCDLTDNWLSQLGHSGNSSKWNAIRLLDLRYNALTSSCCPAIATVISGGLQALLLDGNRLQSQGFEAVCAMAFLACASSLYHSKMARQLRLLLQLRVLAKRSYSQISIFDRPRFLDKKGPVKHDDAKVAEKTEDEDLFPGRGDRRCNTGRALPMAKFEREQAAAASKAPEHKVSRKGPFRDLADADQRLEIPKKQRRVRGPKSAVVLQATARQQQVVQQPKEPKENLLKHFR
eukprot:symbB.v1.2.006791.t1/scaffold396.1/size242164/18